MLISRHQFVYTMCFSMRFCKLINLPRFYGRSCRTRGESFPGLLQRTRPFLDRRCTGQMDLLHRHSSRGLGVGHCGRNIALINSSCRGEGRGVDWFVGRRARRGFQLSRANAAKKPYQVFGNLKTNKQTNKQTKGHEKRKDKQNALLKIILCLNNEAQGRVDFP